MATWSEILAELQELGQHLQRTGGLLPDGTRLPARVSQFDFVRRKYLRQLADHTGRPVILYATKWTQGGAAVDLVSITPEDIQGFMEVVYGLPLGPLDVVLHSPGGSAEAAEALVNYLRSKFTNIRVIVPQAAMSAACMLACSADRIVMARHSSLGPIDPQMVLDTPLGRRMVPVYAILEQFRLAQREAANPQRLGSWLPILQQYGPALIVQCQLAQELARELVQKWLERYMFNGRADARQQAERTAQALADHAKYKSHGRFIPVDQAISEGLAVDLLENDQILQDKVLSIFHSVNITLDATPAVKLIENHQGRAYIKQQQVLQFQPGIPGPQAPVPPPSKPSVN